MTVESSNNKSGPFIASGAAGVFPRNFLVFDPAHIRVVRSRDGIETDITTGIAHSGMGSASGTVTLTQGIQSGDRITLLRNMPNVQRSDYSAQSSVPTDQVELDLDLLAMQVQDLAERQRRALTLPVDSTESGEAAMRAALDAPRYALEAKEAALEARAAADVNVFPEAFGAAGGGADDTAAIQAAFSQAVANGIGSVYLSKSFIGTTAPSGGIRRAGPGKITVGPDEYLGRDDDVLRHDPSANGGDYSIRPTRNRNDITTDAAKRGYYFYQNYSSSRPGSGSLFGYAANVKRTGGGRKVVPAQLNGYSLDASGASVWGIATEAWSGDPTTLPSAPCPLIGGEFAVLSQAHNNDKAVIGGDFVFKNRSDGASDVLYGSAGNNAFNRHSEAIRISTGFNAARPPSGAFTGWATGIKFRPNSLDQSIDRKAVGIDLSEVDPSRMLAAIKLAGGQWIIMGEPVADVFDGINYSAGSRRVEFRRGDSPSASSVRSYVDLSASGPSGVVLATHATANTALAGTGNAVATPSKPQTYLAVRLDGVDYRIPAYSAS